MKVGILGAWHVHAPGYTKTAQELGEVIGVYDRNPSFAAALAKECNIRVFESRDDLLSSDIEGVIVCSATNVHTEDILAAIEAGKAVFTEKVLALKQTDCLRIKEALDQYHVPFVISFPQKYSAGIVTVKQIISAGELGKVNYIRFRNCHSGSSGNWLPAHFYNAEQCGGGAMIDLGAHGMYLIDMLRGLPDTYASTFGLACEREDVLAKNTDRVEDNAITVMGYRDGCIAVNETGFVTVACPMTLEVGGDKGYLTFAGNKVVKATAETGYKPIVAENAAALPSPLQQFMTGNILEGCGIEEAIHLTVMMEKAYQNV